ncbi:MAG TPA: GntR family transcriptional regulator [Anaerolineales bacterium]|nr:GntR family transcriptional regulator [Anaerolineales bacterium]
MIVAVPIQKLRENFVNTLPLYIQIADGLLEKMEAGELSPGERLPPERELSQLLGVNRMTLRRSLQRLELQGLLDRRQGAGTYIAPPKIERQADQLVSFSRGMKKRGYLPGAKLLHFERKPSEASVARELNVPLAVEVYFFQRIRYLNEEPVMLEKFWMPVERFPDLEQFDLVNRFIFDIVEEEYRMTITRARQSLEAVVATEYEAEMLGIRVGAPLMLERRLTFDEHDHPFEFGIDLYRGDRFRFVTEKAPMEQ